MKLYKIFLWLSILCLVPLFIYYTSGKILIYTFNTYGLMYTIKLIPQFFVPSIFFYAIARLFKQNNKIINHTFFVLMFVIGAYSAFSFLGYLPKPESCFAVTSYSDYYCSSDVNCPPSGYETRNKCSYFLAPWYWWGPYPFQYFTFQK
jgi:hypothetical protein